LVIATCGEGFADPVGDVDARIELARSLAFARAQLGRKMDRCSSGQQPPSPIARIAGGAKQLTPRVLAHCRHHGPASVNQCLNYGALQLLHEALKIIKPPNSAVRRDERCILNGPAQRRASVGNHNRPIG
jgi:hypothetical protein